MTHDELLAKINSRIIHCSCNGWGNNCYEDDNVPWLVLRAVVELHKVSDVGLFCDGCARFVEPHPCPTIQAIKKELR